MFIARHARPEAIEAVLRDHRESVELNLTDLRAIIEQLADRLSARFGRLTARWGLLQAEASLTWLDEAEALVASEREVAAENDGRAARGW